MRVCSHKHEAYSKFSKKEKKAFTEAWKKDIPEENRHAIESHFRAELVRSFLGNILDDVVPGRVENLRSEAVNVAFVSSMLHVLNDARYCDTDEPV